MDIDIGVDLSVATFALEGAKVSERPTDIVHCSLFIVQCISAAVSQELFLFVLCFR